jgi:hypothetical protein
MDLADIKDVSVFAEHVGSIFRFEIGPDQFASATLVDASELGPGGSGGAASERVPFSLLFEYDRDTVLSQKVYPVTHDQIGELTLFLVPVGPGQMESVFN